MRFLGICLIGLAGSVTLLADADRARALFAEQRYAEAQALFEQVVVDDPADALAHQYLGRLAQLRRDLPLAIEHMEKAATLRPDDPEVQYDLGAAASLYANSLGVSLRAATYARKGRQALERAVELQPEVFRYREALIEFYTTAPSIVGGGMAKAYAQAEAVRQRDPLQGALTAGRLKLMDKRYAEARQEWQTALALAPAHALALFRLGELAALTGEELEPGRQALQHVLAQPSLPAGVHPAHPVWRLGQIQLQLGDPEAARAAFRAALELDPHHREIAGDLARLPVGSAP